MRGHDEREIEVLEQKLKSAKLRRCNMIFDSLDPCFNDIIYLAEIESHLEYLHPQTRSCLQAFFQSFYLQTKKTSMNRKYFTVNMLSALQRNKFNLYSIFQDPDILELETRIKNIKSIEYNEFEIINEPVLKFHEQDVYFPESNKDLPLQRKQNIYQNSGLYQEKNIEDSFILNPIKDSFLEQDEPPKQNQKKISDYLQQSKIDGFNQSAQKQKSVLFEPQIQDQKSSHQFRNGGKLRKNIFERLYSQSHRSKSSPNSEEVEFEKCTFEPQLHKPLRSVVNKEIRPKVYDFLLNNQIIKFLKDQDKVNPTSERKSYNLNSSIVQKSNENRHEDESRIQYDMKTSIERLLNASGYDLCYRDMYSRKLNYTEQHLLPDYIELTTRRKNFELQSSSKKHGSTKANLYSLHPTPHQSNRETSMENIKPLKISPTQTFINDILKSSNSLINQDESKDPKHLTQIYNLHLKNRKEKQNTNSSRTTGKFKEFKIDQVSNSFIGDTKQIYPLSKIQMSYKNSKPYQNLDDCYKEIKEKGANKTPLRYFLNEASFNIPNNSSQNEINPNQNISFVPRIKESKSKFSPISKEGLNISKSNHYWGKIVNKKKFENKENTSYNFSFTERDVSETHFN